MQDRADRHRRIFGMSKGAANSRLRKALLFEFAKRLELLTCHRCGEQIETIDEFSIEHTVAWEWSEDPLSTFFDLSLIAFSHLPCNVAAASRPNQIYEDQRSRKAATNHRYFAKHGEERNKRRRDRRRAAGCSSVAEHRSGGPGAAGSIPATLTNSLGD